MSDLESFAQSRVGTTLRGKYRLDRLLGVGGMAAVYQATHRVGNRVALKVLHPHMSINADVRARFLREGYVANQVEHRGVVRVLDDDTTDDGTVFLAMDLCEGEPLDRKWRDAGEHLPVREVAELGHQLLDVLAAAHDKGIVHRDIKPENLFLTDGGTLKVLDFGIARLAGVSSPQAATRTGRMLGSPAFMAPEQALGLQRNIDGQTDLWSAGATMFTLLSGSFVHDAETVESMLIFAGSRPARSLRSAAPNVPPAIIDVVDRALAFDKGQRWGSARAMQAALEAAYLAVFGAPIPGARSTPGGSRPRLELHPTLDNNAAPVASGRVSFAPTVQSTQYQPPVQPVQAMLAETHDDTGTEIIRKASAASLPGASTTAGIESERGEGLGAQRARRRQPLLAVGLVGVVAFMAAGAVLLFRGGGKVPMAGSAAPPASIAVPPTTSTPPVPPLATPSDEQPPSVVVSSHPVAPAPRPVTPSPVASAAVRPAPPPLPSASPSASQARPNPECNPPYTLDAVSGERLYKPQCYVK